MEHIGAGFLLQSLNEGSSDRRYLADEMRLAVLCEELGFDAVSVPEHHFESFSWSPNPLQLLTWVAARTSRIAVMPAVVVLPWHDPLRVVEEVAVLDNLCDGRLWMGIGRGFARKEYEGFRIDREEARERFDEAAEFVKRALDTGVAQGDGRYYQQPPVEIRPRFFKSFADRFYCVANSPGSAELAGRLGARMVNFVAGSPESLVGHVEHYRETFRETQGSEPPPILLSDATFCTRDPGLADAARNEYYPNNWAGINDHYEFTTTDFSRVKGYESHAGTGPATLHDKADFADTQVWGTPEEIVEKWRERVSVLGACDAHFIFRHGGMPADVCEGSLRLFAAEAMPALRKLTPRVTATSGV